MSAEKLNEEEIQKLRNIDFSKEPGYKNAEEELTRLVGAPGTPEREEFEAKARAWVYGEMLRAAERTEADPLPQD